MGGDASVVGVGVLNVRNAIVVIVGVEVVRNSVRIQIARPRELVDAAVVIVVLIVPTGACAVVVFIGYAVVVVVHGVLVRQIEFANGTDVGVRVVDGRIEVAVGGHVAWVEAQRLESIVINGPFEDAVVIVVPVINIEDTIVVVVVRVGSITSVESLEQVVDAIVIVVEVSKVVDTVVVVVTGPGFFEEGGI